MSRIYFSLRNFFAVVAEVSGRFLFFRCVVAGAAGEQKEWN
jgi:hypothetical protein